MLACIMYTYSPIHDPEKYGLEFVALIVPFEPATQVQPEGTLAPVESKGHPTAATHT